MGHIYSKNDQIQHKKLIYGIYTTQSFYKVLGKNVFFLGLVQFEWTINHKKVLRPKKKPNIPRAAGDREATSQYHKNCQK